MSTAQQSNALKALSVLLYVLGLSYQGVSDLLEALAHPLSKSSVYHNVQGAGVHASALRRAWLRGACGRVQALGIDFTHVKRLGQDVIVAVATAVLTGAAMDFELIDDESAPTIETWVRGLCQDLQVEVLVSDDADALKTVADELGLEQQLCRAHVNRNVHDLIAALGSKALEQPDPVPEGTALTLAQFLDDLQQLEETIKGLPHDGQAQLEQLAERYQTAPPPAARHKASMWYRMRLLTLDWSEHWSRLTRFQSWRGMGGETLDGTNNVTEQIIGQRVKERYRTMRGYKRDDSITNVSSLIAWIGQQPSGYNLGALV